MTGFAQLDQGLFGQDAGSRANLGDIQDGVGFRRARLQAVGNLSEFTRYSFEMDFATAGRPSFMDVWGEQTNVPFFGNVRIGQFRQPTTMDGWTSIRHLEFMERALPFQALDPFRRVGIMSWFNAGEDDRTLIAYSVYGTGLTFTNRRRTAQLWYARRYALRHANRRQRRRFGGDSRNAPVVLGSLCRRIATCCTSAAATTSARSADRQRRGTQCHATYQARAIPEFFVGDPGGGGLDRATARRLSPIRAAFWPTTITSSTRELAGNYGPAHFQTEYMATLVDQIAGPQVFYHGAYVQAGYFLTGENCGYNKQMGALDYNVKPFREFFGLGRDQWFCGWGAWEIAARYSYVNLASAAILPANQLSAAARCRRHRRIPASSTM